MSHRNLSLPFLDRCHIYFYISQYAKGPVHPFQSRPDYHMYVQQDTPGVLFSGSVTGSAWWIEIKGG
jgi:hypothetical protein